MKKNAYIWITESLCCTPETNTILWVSYNSIKKKTQDNEWLSEDVGNRCALLVRRLIGLATMENNLDVPEGL